MSVTRVVWTCGCYQSPISFLLQLFNPATIWKLINKKSAVCVPSRQITFFENVVPTSIQEYDDAFYDDVDDDDDVVWMLKRRLGMNIVSCCFRRLSFLPTLRTQRCFDVHTTWACRICTFLFSWGSTLSILYLNFLYI